MEILKTPRLKAPTLEPSLTSLSGAGAQPHAAATLLIRLILFNSTCFLPPRKSYQNTVRRGFPWYLISALKRI